jgi:hypothetical protein
MKPKGRVPKVELQVEFSQLSIPLRNHQKLILVLCLCHTIQYYLPTLISRFYNLYIYTKVSCKKKVKEQFIIVRAKLAATGKLAIKKIALRGMAKQALSCYAA